MPHDLAVEADGIAAVGEQGDGEAVFGHQPQEGRLSDRGAVVPDHAGAGAVEDLPAQAPRVTEHTEAGHLHLPLPHQLRRGLAQHCGAVGGRAAVQVHPGEGQQVPRTHGQHRARGGVRRSEGPYGSGLEGIPGCRLYVPDRGPVQDRLVRSARGVGEAERAEQVVVQTGTVGLAAHCLDQPAQHAVAGVVVREQLPRGEELGRVTECGDVLFHTVVVLARVREDVAFEPGRVAE